nr:Chain A, 10-mer ubiquitin peptide [synthetic construct]
LEDGRTLSDY